MRAVSLIVVIVTALAVFPAAAYEPKPNEMALYLPAGSAQAAAYDHGRELYDHAKFREAVAAFDEVLRLQPEFALARSYRAFAYLELREFSQAIAEHDAVLRLAPDRPNSWANSCWARAVADVDLDEALKLCDRAVAMGGGLNAYDSRGFVRFRQGKFQAAIDDYTHAIREDRTVASAWFMRGVAKLRVGQETAGRKDMEWALARDPFIDETYGRRGVQP